MGVVVGLAQQFVEVSRHAQMLRLGFQQRQFAGREDDLPHPGGFQCGQSIGRAGAQGAGKACRVVAGHIVRRQRFKAAF